MAQVRCYFYSCSTADSVVIISDTDYALTSVSRAC